MTGPLILVLGAGFGGLNAARSLARAPVTVRLADRQNYHTFQPLLCQVATAVLAPEDIAHNVRAIFRGQENFSFCLGVVSEVDLEARRAVLQIEGVRPVTLKYDYLILALGATTDTYHVPGVQEHTFMRKSLDDAVALRNHILRQFELVDAGRADISDGALTFVIVGGGFTGVELPGGLQIRGFLAWTAWLTLHLVELIGFRNRALVLLNWAWDYVAYERGARLIH